MRLLFYLSGTILIVMLVIFLVLSYVTPVQKKPIALIVNGTSFVSLYFKPSTMYLKCNNDGESLPIYISSGKNSLSSVQIELSYNPMIIHNVMLIPSDKNFFGKKTDYQIDLEEVREEYGRASLALEKAPNQSEKTGNMPVAVLSFETYNILEPQTTEITFLNKSSTMSQDVNHSLLKSTIPLTIYCQPSKL